MRNLLAATIVTMLLVGPAAAGNLAIKFTTDWKIQGIHGWFYLARDKGYFAEEGLDVTIDQGEGSAATVTRVMSGAYDAGFGDMNAIVQNAATNPEQAPVMVYQIYNQPPFSILAKADGPVKKASDLNGLTVGAPPGSAVTKLFPALASKAGIDLATVEIIHVQPNIQEQMLLRGNVDASLVFNVTSYLNLIGLGLDPDRDFRFIGYGESGLDIYSNGVMVSRDLHDNHPEAVAGLVRAINRAVMEVIADPSLGAAAVKAEEPLLDAALEAKRLDFALSRLIDSPETRELGVGAVDMARLARTIGVLQEIEGFETAPEAAAIFDAAFLPPLEDRRR
ncbi:ABC transporter substrate-binding protein [Rubrimonas cliftonensis]|uniref:Thiamine pyrimidine synthase n=1 Tax=Rubrimonas cliftonensis TaxID=89524 RepID=A0A1H4A9X6_9RHOB|nr:ABC transporter substrate-binding protein [Rubrimonas cliftonensis]SEA32799.1 NitT/TauT family transport system substrate-binding protein [Rubrimonas cliftonensis]